ncbi:MAG TPA: hypothetical protein VGH20_09180 [Myxococcales bacterium]
MISSLLMSVGSSAAWAQFVAAPPTTSRAEPASPPATLVAPSGTGASIARSDTNTDQATWRIIGSGYGQLVNATDSSTAFSLAVAYSYARLDAIFQLQRGNKTDALTSPKQMGQFVLSPLSGNYALSIAADYRPWGLPAFADERHGHSGVYGYFTAGTATWSGIDHHPTGGDTTPVNLDAVGLAGGAGFSTQIVSSLGDTGLGTGGNTVAVIGRIGAAYRGIAGSVVGSPAFLEQNTSRRSTSFLGGEVQLALQINTITAAIAVPVLAGHFDGLTNGQVVPSLQLGGSFDVTSH